MSKSEIFIQALKSNGYSATKPRQILFDVLAQNDAVSMNQLTTLIDGKIDRTSVYRSVDLLEKLGIINRIHIGWKYKIELSEQFSSHHHHSACIQCDKIVMFKEDKKLEKDIHDLADSIGFTLNGHTLELRGYCKDCRKVADLHGET